MLAIFLCAEGLKFSGEATVQSIYKNQDNKKDQKLFHSGITNTRLNVDFSKKENDWEVGYSATVNPSLFTLGYVFENNYLWCKWGNFGEFRAGNLYGPDVELASPVQKLLNINEIDDFYINSSGYFHGRAVGSSGIAAKGVYYSPKFGCENHTVRFGVSYAPDTSVNGPRFNTQKSLNYKASLPTSNYANVWTSDNVTPVGEHHVTVASQYQGKWSEVDVTVGAAYLFGKAKLHDNAANATYDLNDKHSYSVSVGAAYKTLEIVGEFLSNGKGGLQSKDSKDDLSALTWVDSSKGTSGKAVNVAVKLNVTDKVYVSVGQQFLWNYMTEEHKSSRRATVGTFGYNVNDHYGFFVKGGYVKSVLPDAAAAAVKADADGSNTGVFIGTGISARF